MSVVYVATTAYLLVKGMLLSSIYLLYLNLAKLATVDILIVAMYRYINDIDRLEMYL